MVLIQDGSHVHCSVHYQRLMAMLLRPECPHNIFTAGHGAAALIIEAQDGWHHITAGDPL